MSHRTPLPLLGILVVTLALTEVPAVSAGQGAPGIAVPHGREVIAGQGTAGTSIPHVRGSDPLARQLLELGAARSPTIAGLVAELERSDLVVYVGTGRLRSGINGSTQFAVATATARYLRVVLRLPNATKTLLEVLGHELRHAVEMAGMPEVRDELSLRAAYRRIGFETSRGGFYETAEAVEAGRKVEGEIRHLVIW